MYDPYINCFAKADPADAVCMYNPTVRPWYQQAVATGAGEASISSYPSIDGTEIFSTMQILIEDSN